MSSVSPCIYYVHKIISHTEMAINPLDLIFFKGVDPLSITIRIIEDIAFEEDSFSHVGLVVTRDLLPDVTELEHGKLYIFESTLSVLCKDAETHRRKFGVQIRELESVIDAYKFLPGAKVAHVKLTANPWQGNEYNRKFCIKTMKVIHEKYGNNMYDINAFDLLATVTVPLRKYRLFLNKFIVAGYSFLSTSSVITTQDIDEKMLFCSELVALVYQRLGILPKSVYPSDVAPMTLIELGRQGKLPIAIDPVYL